MRNATLNILFICSSLEPGKDGVGDYTRKLAGALLKSGHNAAIIAINDRQCKADIWQGEQNEHTTSVTVIRLPASLPWDQRLAKAKEFAATFNADWISLQYVPFGFHLKGLPFNLGKKLKQLGPHLHWHIMFHELSVNKDESLKFKLWAYLQIRIIRSLLQMLQPGLITTNTEIYRSRLEEMGYITKLLPLFSNVSPVKGAGMRAFDAIIPEFIVTNRKDFTIGTLFGSFDFKSWNMRSLLNQFSNACIDKRIVIVSIGRMSSGNEFWEALQDEYPHILFIALGMQGTEFISYWLSEYTDFGILTTLPELAGKSGSFMAFKEHGIPVVCKEQTPGLESYSISFDKDLTVIDSKTKFVLPVKYQPVALLDEVVKQFIDELMSVNTLQGTSSR